MPLIGANPPLFGVVTMLLRVFLMAVPVVVSCAKDALRS